MLNLPRNTVVCSNDRHITPTNLTRPKLMVDAHPIQTPDFTHIQLAESAFEQARCEVLKRPRRLDSLWEFVRGRGVFLWAPMAVWHETVIAFHRGFIIFDRMLALVVIDTDPDVIDSDEIGLIRDVVNELI